MKEIRVYKVMHYWIDVEVEDENDAEEVAMEQDLCNWECEEVESGIVDM
jgi:hypothetical protein